MIERNALQQLLRWSEKTSRKPLVLRGARQVGKTTLVNEFSKNFDNYLYLNLDEPRLAALFDTDSSTEDILNAIYIYLKQPKKEGKTLLFIDEIQNSPLAVARLRYFYEQLPEVYVIAAGSLLESLIDVHISFPVGRVEYLAVRPLSFTEFLKAFDETELKLQIENAQLSELLHPLAMKYFNTYTLIGGMPEVVSQYAEYKDLIALNDTFDAIVTGYRDDVEKYASNKTMVQTIRYILNEGWKYAAQSITLGGFNGSSYKSREVGEAFRTLEKTMLLELTFPASSYFPPIKTEEKRSPRLFWLDTGLVNYVAGIQIEIFGSKDITDAWRGKIAEQIVAQELLSTDSRVSSKRHFWVRDKKGSDAEIDFIVQHNNHIIPIEVKSGHNSRLKSLHLFMEHANHDLAIRVWSNPLSVDRVQAVSGKEFRLLNIPFYYVGQIPALLQMYDKNEHQQI